MTSSSSSKDEPASKKRKRAATRGSESNDTKKNDAADSKNSQVDLLPDQGAFVWFIDMYQEGQSRPLPGGVWSSLRYACSSYAGVRGRELNNGKVPRGIRYRKLEDARTGAKMLASGELLEEDFLCIADQYEGPVNTGDRRRLVEAEDKKWLNRIKKREREQRVAAKKAAEAQA
jgi:hypothetical protein